MYEHPTKITTQPLYQEKFLLHELHTRERRSKSDPNARVAMLITRIFQSMHTFWVVVIWIVLWIVLNVTILRFDPPPFDLLLLLVNIPQLPLMIVIMVGQALFAQKQDIQISEQIEMVKKISHDLSELVAHLAAQDAELVKQTRLLEQALYPSSREDIHL